MAKTFFGVMLLLFGGLLFFNVLGLGWFLRLVISLVIITFAMNKIKQAKTPTQKGFGIAVFLFGVLLFFGGVHLLFGLLVGLSLIFVGFKMLKRDNVRDAPEDKLTFQGNTPVHEDAFDIKWNKKMKK